MDLNGPFECAGCGNQIEKGQIYFGRRAEQGHVKCVIGKNPTMLKAFVNEVDGDKWVVTFGAPLMPTYEGVEIEVDSDTAQQLLSLQ